MSDIVSLSWSEPLSGKHDTIVNIEFTLVGFELAYSANRTVMLNKLNYRVNWGEHISSNPYL
jgi:hypothetical protein